MTGLRSLIDVWRRRGLYQASIHSKMAAASSRRVVQVYRSNNSRCRVPKNDSIIALSNEEPTRSIEPSKPAARSRWPKAYAVYYAPRSECTTVWPAGGRRRQRAISRASTTSSRRKKWSAIDRPTIRREYTSSTAAQ